MFRDIPDTLDTLSGIFTTILLLLYFDLLITMVRTVVAAIYMSIFFTMRNSGYNTSPTVLWVQARSWLF